MTKHQLIEWIEQNINDNAGNVECGLRLLQNNIIAINSTMPDFVVCAEKNNKQADDIMASEFFQSLLAKKSAMVQTSA